MYKFLNENVDVTISPTRGIVQLDFPADDFHVHLRDDDDRRLQLSAPMTARQFNRALIMPNLKPPVRTAQEAIAYRDRILRYTGDEFEPLMALYLTGETRPEDIRAITESGGRVVAVKYYPAGATTNSEAGVSNIRDSMVLETIAALEEYNIAFCLHGETADQSVDVFDREEAFMADFFFLRNRFCNLRMVLEHITTIEAVQAVRRTQSAYAGRTAATATPQHILANRNFMLGNGLDPHAYCKPIAKREEHRVAVLEAATSGEPWFFLGTDSAPHDRNTKESACGCAGCFTGLHALELYAEAFASVGKIHMLPDFAGYFGAQFYGLPAPTRRVSLALRDWTVPMAIDYNGMQYHQETGAFGTVVPFYAGKTLQWKMLG